MTELLKVYIFNIINNIVGIVTFLAYFIASSIKNDIGKFVSDNGVELLLFVFLLIFAIAFFRIARDYKKMQGKHKQLKKDYENIKNKSNKSPDPLLQNSGYSIEGHKIKLSEQAELVCVKLEREYFVKGLEQKFAEAEKYVEHGKIMFAADKYKEIFQAISGKGVPGLKRAIEELGDISIGGYIGKRRDFEIIISDTNRDILSYLSK